MRNLTNLLTGFCLLCFFASCNNKQKVSLIVQHATIYTADSSFSEVQAMAINDGKIIATGTDEEIMKKYSSDSITDAKGKPVFRAKAYTMGMTTTKAELKNIGIPTTRLERRIATLQPCR